MLRTRLKTSVIFIATLVGLFPALGQFTPGPKFSERPVPCDLPYHQAEDICRELLEAFAFTVNGIGWEASKGLITDGASIPWWARGIVGEPFAGEFAKAATLHVTKLRRRIQFTVASGCRLCTSVRERRWRVSGGDKSLMIPPRGSVFAITHPDSNVEIGVGRGLAGFGSLAEKVDASRFATGRAEG